MKTENIEDIYELSPLQKGILFHSLYAPEMGLYVIQVSYTVRGHLNFVAFERAWQQVVARHTIMRTSFYWEEIDKPLQVVNRQAEMLIEQQDWRGIDSVEQDKHLEFFLNSDRSSGFDFSQAPLMRVTLIRLADHCYQIVLSKHHLILDGWSSSLVLKDFVQIYEALCQRQDASLAPGSCFGDYIAWLQNQDLSTAEVYWRQVLCGLKAPTCLTNLDVDNLSRQEERYDEERLQLSEATTAALQSLARQHQLTLNTLFQGAWALLLSRYSCENNVVYGCTVSGRPVDLVGSESMVGVFINTLPVWVKVDTEQSLLPWLKQLQAQLVEIRQYEYSPLVDIQGWSEVPRGVPLFESITVFENYPVDRVLRQWEGSLEILNHSLFYKTNYPLTVVAYPGLELAIAISYDCRRFDAATIRGVLNHFNILLYSMLTTPEVCLKDLQLLITAEPEILSSLEKEATFDLAFCN